MRIVLLGAGGQVARRIAHEAMQRHHDVVGVVRSAKAYRSDNERVTIVEGDATNADSIASIAKGANVVVNAVSPRPSPTGRAATSLPAAAQAVIAGVKKAGVPRLIIVGGAGSLEVAPGVRLVDTPDFPPAYKPESLDQAASLDVYRTSAGDLDWTYISPAVEMSVGSRTGHYRIGDDSVLADATGKSFISYDDYAKAVVDEIEHPTHPRARMTVAY